MKSFLDAYTRVKFISNGGIVIDIMLVTVG